MCEFCKIINPLNSNLIMLGKHFEKYDSTFGNDILLLKSFNFKLAINMGCKKLDIILMKLVMQENALERKNQQIDCKIFCFLVGFKC